MSNLAARTWSLHRNTGTHWSLALATDPRLPKVIGARYCKFQIRIILMLNTQDVIILKVRNPKPKQTIKLNYTENEKSIITRFESTLINNITE